MVVNTVFEDVEDLVKGVGLEDDVFDFGGDFILFVKFNDKVDGVGTAEEDKLGVGVFREFEDVEDLGAVCAGEEVVDFVDEDDARVVRIKLGTVYWMESLSQRRDLSRSKIMV